MKLTTRARYGLQAMLDLAMHTGNGPVMLRNIAKRQGISGRYLENIMVHLVAGGLIRSTRGQGGGFALARPAADIRLSQIIQTAEGTLSLASCIDNAAGCSRTHRCAIRGVWSGLKGAMFSYLDSITLAAVAAKQTALDRPPATRGTGG